MLVLTRRIGEEIAIDGAIRVKVLSIAGNQIRIGVTAPADIGVWRSELVANGPVEKGRPRKTGNELQQAPRT